MIGEPELDGGWQAGPPLDEARPEAPRGPARRRPPWLWALVGALAASAVWAGLPAALDRFPAAPRISYRHSEDLCKDAPLTALGTMAGGFEKGRSRRGGSPALDWALCSYDSPRIPGKASYHGEVRVDLHKKTDPGPEFGTQLLIDPYGDAEPDRPEQVPGLGERALIGGTVREPRLQVLDGGTVFTVTAQWWAESAAVETDGDALRAAMIQDARVMVAALKKR
ncbi:hypothetical protein ACIGFK_05955 [Streptomyces sp. NPDC085524]|uniref:hypothetical protein n=1 Tax=unclassified Streptomyces TaxID=2593676 RepID=UPI0035D8DF29